MNERLRSLVKWMKENDIDISFVTSPNNIFYLSGFYSDPHERLLSLIIFQNSEPVLICPAMEQSDVRQSGWLFDLIGYDDTSNPWELLKEDVSRRNINVENIAFEHEHITFKRYEKLKSYFNSVTFTPLDETLKKFRLIKDDSEVKKLKEACRLADFAIKTGIAQIREGKTELEIVATIEYELKKQGVLQVSFPTIVLTGKKSSLPHGTPGETKIKKGDFVLFDLGVVIDGYCSDITRTVVFHEHTEQQELIYNTVLKAQLEAIKTVKHGVTCAEVDLAARNIIKDANFNNYFPHRVGHGLGIIVHEYPSVTETNYLKLEKGTVFTIEPGIYVPNIGGVRIEDDIFITDNGCEVLTSFPKELQVIK